MKADVALLVFPFKDGAIAGNPLRAPIAPNRERVHGRHMLCLVTVHTVATHTALQRQM
jgi:hypothetical protein